MTNRTPRRYGDGEPRYCSACKRKMSGALKHLSRRVRVCVPAMTDGDAENLAKYWWGESALASPSNNEDDPFGVGHWDAEDATHFVCLGIGDSWEEAFREADPVRWKAYMVTRKGRRMFAKAKAQP